MAHECAPEPARIFGARLTQCGLPKSGAVWVPREKRLVRVRGGIRLAAEEPGAQAPYRVVLRQRHTRERRPRQPPPGQLSLRLDASAGGRSLDPSPHAHSRVICSLQRMCDRTSGWQTCLAKRLQPFLAVHDGCSPPQHCHPVGGSPGAHVPRPISIHSRSTDVHPGPIRSRIQPIVKIKSSVVGSTRSVSVPSPGPCRWSARRPARCRCYPLPRVENMALVAGCLPSRREDTEMDRCFLYACYRNPIRGGAPRDGTLVDEVLAYVQGHFAAMPGGPRPRVLCAASQWTRASKTRTSRGSSSTRISATNPRNFRRSRADWPVSGSS